MSQSLVYSHIYVYRMVMNLLYGGRYRRRLSDVIDVIDRDVQSVCDLCFGDTVIAEWCRSHGVKWTGVDLNAHFCARARAEGFDVLEGDLLSLDLPSADVFVMAGSLYHFHDQLPRLFDALWRRTSRFILSEPIRNLSSRQGVLGWWAGRFANPGDKVAAFRYDEHSLLDALRDHQQRCGFTFRVVSTQRDMLVVIDRTNATAPSVC